MKRKESGPWDTIWGLFRFGYACMIVTLSVAMIASPFVAGWHFVVKPLIGLIAGLIA